VDTGKTTSFTGAAEDKQRSGGGNLSYQMPTVAQIEAAATRIDEARAKAIKKAKKAGKNAAEAASDAATEGGAKGDSANQTADEPAEALPDPENMASPSGQESAWDAALVLCGLEAREQWKPGTARGLTLTEAFARFVLATGYRPCSLRQLIRFAAETNVSLARINESFQDVLEQDEEERRARGEAVPELAEPGPPPPFALTELPDAPEKRRRSYWTDFNRSVASMRRFLTDDQARSSAPPTVKAYREWVRENEGPSPAQFSHFGGFAAVVALARKDNPDEPGAAAQSAGIREAEASAGASPLTISPSKRAPVGERLRALVRVGALVPGEEFRATYKGQTYSAHLAEDGSGLIMEGHEKPLSLTGALTKGVENRTWNGWDWWCVQRDGKWVRLAKVREQALKEVP